MQSVFDMLSRLPGRFLIVGGHALAAHALVRQTLDVDCLIMAEDEEMFGKHLQSAGWQLTGRSENFARYDAASPDVPSVDVLLVDRETFAKLQSESIPLRRGAHEFQVPGMAQLIALKLHAIRNEPRRTARDLGDIAELLRLNAGRITTGDLDKLCEKFGPAGIRAKLHELE